MLVCTEHHNGSTGSLISANAIASAVAQLAIDVESLNESNFSGLGAVQDDLQQVLDTSGDFTSFSSSRLPDAVPSCETRALLRVSMSALPVPPVRVTRPKPLSSFPASWANASMFI